MKPLLVVARVLPEAWERSIKELWERGVIVETEYGEKSKDLPAIIVVEEPLSEPRIHLKGVVAGRLSGLFEYVEEVLSGVNDWRIGKDWHYTYHERLFAYKVDSRVYDQISYVVEKLKEAPFSRRAQAITWQPWKDCKTDSPPCLQRVWFRVVEGKLVMHAHMRSNDALKAAFMNMYAFTELQRKVAEELGVPVGYYMHVADSYHVYERDWKWAEKFAEQVASGSSRRYWMTTEAFKALAYRARRSSGS